MATLTITNAALNLLRDVQNGQLTGVKVDGRVYYMAIGTGSTAPAVTDTQLAAEVFRKPITSYTNTGVAGETIITCYLSPSDAVGVVIGEVGFFAGASATTSANSGILVGRALYSHTHTNLEAIQFSLDLTI